MVEISNQMKHPIKKSDLIALSNAKLITGQQRCIMIDYFFHKKDVRTMAKERQMTIKWTKAQLEHGIEILKEFYRLLLRNRKYVK